MIVKTGLGLVAAMAAWAGAANAETASTPNDLANSAPLACRADRTLDCGLQTCAADAEAGDLPVELSLNPATGRGELCTYTYCRGFTLLRAPGAPKSLPRWSGFTLSQRSGSTGPGSDQPIIDYQLSVAPDGSAFVLVNVDDGRISGWAGPCRRN